MNIKASLWNNKKSVITKIVVVIVALVLMLLSYKFSKFDKDYTVAIGAASSAYQMGSGETISQTFELEPGQIRSLGVMFGTFSRDNQGVLHATLLDGDTVIKEWEISTSGFADNDYYYFELDNFVNSETHTYTLTLNDGYEGDNGLAIWTYDGLDSAVSNWNGPINQSVCINVSNHETGIDKLMLGICIVSIILMALVWLFEEKLPSRGFVIKACLLIIYVAVNSYLCIHHEAWRDEAQHWLIAKNCSIPEILGRLSNEGHPILWFLVLKVFLLFGFKYKYFSLISLLIMVVAAGVMLFKAKLPVIIDAIILVSPLFMYYNTAVARNYCIAVLMMVLCAVLREDRVKHPYRYMVAIALLIQTHTLCLGLGLGLIMELIYEALFKYSRKNLKQNLLPVIIPIVSVLILVATLYQGNKPAYAKISLGSVIGKLLDTYEINVGILSISNSLCKVDIANAFWIAEVSLILITIVALYSAGLLKKCLPEVLVMLFSKATIIAIVVGVKRATHAPQASMYVLVTVFFIIAITNKLQGETGTVTKVLMNVIYVALACSVLVMVSRTYYDAKMDKDYPYSNSQAMAEYIISSTPEDSIFLVNESDPYVYSVVAYVEDYRDDVFFSVDRLDVYNNHVWDNWPVNTQSEIDAAALSVGDSHKVYYLSGIIDNTITYSLNHSENVRTEYMEDFYLYEVN